MGDPHPPVFQKTQFENDPQPAGHFFCYEVLNRTGNGSDFSGTKDHEKGVEFFWKEEIRPTHESNRLGANGLATHTISSRIAFQKVHEKPENPMFFQYLADFREARFLLFLLMTKLYKPQYGVILPQIL